MSVSKGTKATERLLKDFNLFLQKRDTSQLKRLIIRIEKNNWTAHLQNTLREQDGLQSIGDSALKQYADTTWKDLTSIMKKWDTSKRNSKRWTTLGMTQVYNTKVIEIRVKNIAKRPAKTWINNAVKSVKNHLKSSKNSFPAPKIITAEHGGVRQTAQSGQGTLTGGKDFAAGALGNNVSNAIVSALSKAVQRNDKFLSFSKQVVFNFMEQKYSKRIRKNRNVNKFIAEHETTITLIPNKALGNDGRPDKEEAKNFRQQYEEALGQFLKGRAMDFDEFSTSPDILNEFDDFYDRAGLKHISEKAGIRLTKSGALDKRFKGVTKKGGLDLRYNFSKELLDSYDRAKPKRSTKTTGGKTIRPKAVVNEEVIQAATGVSIKSKPQLRSDRFTQAAGLKEILDEFIEETVARKMKEPALVYRSGRFAASVDIVNCIIGPRGGLTIDYTYDLFPYQTFEPGFKQGSTLRDPRKIIGQSIRELVAANMKGMQPLIRRV